MQNNLHPKIKMDNQNIKNKIKKNKALLFGITSRKNCISNNLKK